MNISTREYPGFTLHMIEAEVSDEVPAAGEEGFYRVEVSCHRDNIGTMLEKGYLFADRSIGVVINLRGNRIDYEKMIRFETMLEKDEKDDILRIALNSFPDDSRFHVRPLDDDETAAIIIRNWVENLSEVYLCIHKEQIVGFLDLEPYGDKDLFVHLAAVEGKYRAAGAAVSLYAKAVTVAIEKGCERLYGRISSRNTAVMNLYTRFGGTFYDPKDVFVRKE